MDKRTPSQYVLFVGEQRKLGKTMKEAAELWKEKKIVVHTDSPTEQAASLCELNLQVNGKEYKSSGETIMEAINNLQFKEIKFFTKAILVATYNGKEYKKVIPTMQLRGFAWGKEIVRIVWAKNLTVMLT